jgi:hypothetical protein
MFEFGKKKVFATMNGFVATIQFALYAAALQEQRRLGYEDKFVAAAAANFLVGKDSNSSHTDDQKHAAKNLAETMIRQDHEIFFAAVMCLRTTGITGGPESFIWTMSTMDWIGTVGELPNFPPNPDSMQELAYHMATKYPDAFEIR